MLRGWGSLLCSDIRNTSGIPGLIWRQDNNGRTGTLSDSPVMFTGMQMENQGDSEALDAATLRQQRRLKQAIRFLHRDSADLLPLDGLKKLGTSKQGVRPDVINALSH